MPAVSTQALSRTVLPRAERCERPRVVRSSEATLYPGRLAQGPEEKFGLAGLFVGFTQYHLEGALVLKLAVLARSTTTAG